MAKVLVHSILDYEHAQLLTTDARAFVADEPHEVGGDDLGPDPYQLLLWSLGACTAITLQMYARRRKIPLHEVAVEVEHERLHASDCSDCVEGKDSHLEIVYRRITLRGEDITDEQRDAMLRVAERCPVHRTLTSAPDIVDTIDVVA